MKYKIKCKLDHMREKIESQQTLWSNYRLMPVYYICHDIFMMWLCQSYYDVGVKIVFGPYWPLLLSPNSIWP